MVLETEICSRIINILVKLWIIIKKIKQYNSISETTVQYSKGIVIFSENCFQNLNMLRNLTSIFYFNTNNSFYVIF